MNIDANKSIEIQHNNRYRMQQYPITHKNMEYWLNQSYGAITFIGSGAGYDGYHEDGNWRKEHSMGGGALYDMGVYAINGIRIAMNAEDRKSTRLNSSHVASSYAVLCLT